MPACGQCGKDNPEGTAFCGYCATPLRTPASAPGPSSSTAGGKPIVAPQIRGGSPPPQPSRPEIRTPTFATPSSSGGGGKGKGGGGFELLPWSELSSGQKAGRLLAAAVLLFLIFFFLRGMLRGLTGGSGTNEPAPSAQGSGSGAPITEGDRKDGIESLCKVFQIYGLPKNDHDATDAAHNAAELFKLAGDQSPERSNYILTTIVAEFRSGKLGEADCTNAGAPVPTNSEESPDNSNPDIRRDSSQ